MHFSSTFHARFKEGKSCYEALKRENIKETYKVIMKKELTKVVL